MATLSCALKYFTPELGAALRSCARPTLPVKLVPEAYALQTVPGSLRSTIFKKNDTPIPETTTEESGGDGPKRKLHRYNLPLWASKFGGFGYLPKACPYPRNTSTNVPLQLLVQFNLDELALSSDQMFETPLWPTRGIMSIYIDPFDDLYGCTFVPHAPQVGYRVLFFENAMEEINTLTKDFHRTDDGSDAAMTALEESLSALMWTREEQYNLFADDDTEDEPLEERRRMWELPVEQPGKEHEEKRAPRLWYGHPISGEFAMTRCDPPPSVLTVPTDGIDFNTLVEAPALAEHPDLQTLFKDEHCYYVEYSTTSVEKRRKQSSGFSEEEDGSDDMDELPGDVLCNYLGGFPQFTQSDPRERTTDTGEPDLVLFSSSECGQELMWGDSGIANFFIRSEDLRDRKFDKTWFTWDCC